MRRSNRSLSLPAHRMEPKAPTPTHSRAGVVRPLDNFLDLPPGPATFVVNGWLALIRHLAPGLHAIRIESTFLNSSEPDVTNRSIEVVRSR